MKNGGKTSEKGDIMFGSSRCDRFLHRTADRIRFTRIHESNTKFWEEKRLKKEKSHVMVTLK